jgi:ligand-binding sensor domain-containing protein/signal transduction histidine kinase
MRILPVCFLGLLMVVRFSADAQRQHIRFTRLGTDQGLSQSNATCILQGSRGFIWIGTRDGLNKYDGYQFTVYRNQAGDSSSLSNSYITSLAEDRQGNIWIGTWGGGLNRLDRAHHRFTRYNLHGTKNGDVADDFINTLLIDSKGRLWIGTDGDGLDILDPLTGKCVNNGGKGKLGDNDVTALFEDSRHSVWVGTFRGGLCRMGEGGCLQRYVHSAADPGSLSSNSVYRIFEDSRHRLFVGTRGGGLNRLDREAGIFQHYSKDIGAYDVSALNEDERGNIWVGTENGGLCVLDASTDKLDRFVQDDIDNTSLANNSIDCIYRDRQGNMWLGTYSGGVNVFMKDANLFTTFRHNSAAGSLGNNNVLYLLEDSARTIWIGTDGGGLEAMDPGTGVIRQYRHSATDAGSMGGDYVLSIREDGQGRLWAGTWGDGVSVLDKSRKRFTHYRNRPGDTSSLGGNNIYSIARDGDGDLWLAAFGSCLDLYLPEKNAFRHFRHDPADANSLSSNRIHTLLADAEGYLWIGTFDGGLDRLDKRTGKFSHYIHLNEANSLSNNSVNCIYEDSRHRLWIGTGDGLNRLDRATGRFQVWRTSDGLPNNVIAGIVEDAAGSLWISTNNGLSRFDPATGLFRNFTSADGLQGNEFKPHSCLRSGTGRLYFGGIAGFNEFFPDSVLGSRFVSAPPLVITGFQLFNREVPVATDSLATPLKQDITETGSLTLPWSSTVMSFDFALLNFATPGRNQYAYTLEGFDTGWNYIGGRRRATYTHLEPGEYVLRVKAGDSQGNWDPTIRTLAIRITPPFWKTAWFRLMLVLALVAAVVGAHILRTRGLQRQKKKLEDQVTKLLDRAVAQGKHELASEILHDIGNAIIGFSSYITRMKRLLEGNTVQSLSSLAGFFRDNRAPLAGAIGEDRAGAVITLVDGLARTQKETQEEMNKVVTDQYTTTLRIQEILHIQRQYLTGQDSQDRKPVHLEKVISDAIAMLSATFQKNDITVDFQPGKEPFVIKGDRTRLMQLALNVLKNSIEAMEATKGERVIHIRLLRRDKDLHIQVRDTGIGFDEQTAEKLFVRGFSTKASGGGVGLYQCKTILDSHNGSLVLASEGPGKGCLATVIFQAA